MRYLLKRPRQYWDDEEVARLDLPSSIAIHENNDSERTGLLDMHGNEIYRVRERQKLGFDLG